MITHRIHPPTVTNCPGCGHHSALETYSYQPAQDGRLASVRYHCEPCGDISLAVFSTGPYWEPASGWRWIGGFLLTDRTKGTP